MQQWTPGECFWLQGFSVEGLASSLQTSRRRQNQLPSEQRI
jgi:hypothetical protein